MSIFEQASRLKLRFTSVQGDLTVEQLWDLPLNSERPAKANLNTVAQAIDNSIGSAVSKNFVDDTPAVSPELTLKLEVVKSIIATKKAENAAAAKKIADKAELDLLTSLLAEKQNDELKGKSKDELLARIKEIRGF